MRASSWIDGIGGRVSWDLKALGLGSEVVVCLRVGKKKDCNLRGWRVLSFGC
uniref:Uncharacterized protein n=1 Tax=Nelumbo nucifera TaxID=4432 RepID=A0A822XNN9_NELNU|nr:TPA_asm: hypothetical protein HUJ06_022776 [Nelumbo nucifera]